MERNSQDSLDISIERIQITEVLDVSSRDGIRHMPSIMKVDAKVNGMFVSGISLPYIPVTNTKLLVAAITNFLAIEETKAH